MNSDDIILDVEQSALQAPHPPTDVEQSVLQAPRAPYLILLDVNGVLSTKIAPEDTTRVAPEDQVQINSHYHAIIRPGIKAAILELSSKYMVGIYSSTMYRNLIKIVDSIFGRSHPFVLIADRTVTQLDPRYGTDPTIQDFDTVKILDCIWKHPVHNAKRQWSPDNTLLVDHDLRKLDFNPPETILVVPEFTLETYLSETNSVTDLLAAIEAKIQS